MTKVIEFDIKDEEDEGLWEEPSESFAEPPKAGAYRMQIKEINPDKTKDGDPMIVVVGDIYATKEGDTEAMKELGHKGGDCTGYRFWERISFSKAAQWKMAQFLRAIGEGSPKKTKGKFKAEKHEGKTNVLVTIKHGEYDGNYRPEIRSFFHISKAEEDGEPDTGPEELDEAEELAEEDDFEEAFEDDEDDEDEEVFLTLDDLEAMTNKELKALAKEHDVSLKGVKKKADAVERLADELDIDDVPF